MESSKGTETLKNPLKKGDRGNKVKKDSMPNHVQGGWRGRLENRRVCETVSSLKPLDPVSRRGVLGHMTK